MKTTRNLNSYVTIKRNVMRYGNFADISSLLLTSHESWESTSWTMSQLCIWEVFLWDRSANEQTGHLIVSSQYRPWTLATPEVLQVRYRYFEGRDVGEWGFGLRYNLTQFVIVSMHDKRVGNHRLKGSVY